MAFQQQLLGHTLEILLRVLIQRTAVGTLLQEEVITTCYSLASVDFTAFFNSFLPSFLGTIQNISSEEFQGLLTIPKETVRHITLKYTFKVQILIYFIF